MRMRKFLTARRGTLGPLSTVCRKGKLDKIVTMSVSRFARNLPDGLAILRELAAAGVTVHFVKESIDTESLLAQAVRE